MMQNENWPVPEWRTTDPGEQGMDRELPEKLRSVITSEYANTNGIVVVRNGCIVCEEYFHGFGPDVPVHVASVTKSVLSALTGIAVDTNKRKMVLANNTGGLSGPAVRPVALRMVWQSAKKVHIPIIGMGGIETGEDAAAFMLCGAKAVMVGTANFTDPFACPRIIRELDAYCDRQNVRSAQELVGTLEENG